MRIPLLLAVAVLAFASPGVETRVERLDGGLFRVRTKRGAIWPESGMNRYGVLENLPVRETMTDLSALKVKPSLKLTEKGFEVSFPLGEATEVYGLGDVCRTNIMRRGASYEMWIRNVSSYAPIPLVQTSEGWGVFVNTTWRHTFDVGESDTGSLKVSAPEGELDFYFIEGDGYAALLDAYTRLAGRPALLPVWGYGFTYVCNENVDEFRLLDEARTFRREGLPCDVIGLEPGWMSTRYDYTTRKDWDGAKFHFPSWAPNGACGTWGATEATIWPQALANMGFRLSLWLCCDYDLFRYEEQCAAGVARKAGRQPDLRAGIPEFWQDDRIIGAKSQKDHRYRPELEHEEGTLPWFEHLKKFVDQGAQAFKLDGANQIREQAADRKWANGMTTEEAHNLYPLVYAKQMARGYEDYTGRRAMVYSAGGWAGVQRYAATWAGDTGGGVKPLASLLNHAFPGHTNHSCDMQIGDPASRHFGFLQTWSQQNNWYYWKQAWYMAPEKLEAFREYARLRYALVPYLYTAAARAARTGWPVTRPLAMDWPGAGYSQTVTTYRLGDALLVSAFSDETAIPPGDWFDWWTGEKVSGPAKRRETITENHGGGLYVKAGAIIPTWRGLDHLSKGWNEEVVFEVWPSADGDAELYEDDGISLAYREGAFARTPLSVRRDGERGIRFAVGRREGAFDGMPESRRVKVHFHFGDRVLERDMGTVGGEGAEIVIPLSAFAVRSGETPRQHRAAAAVEQPYEFRSRLTCVHRVDRRDMSLKAVPGEFEFSDGAQIFLPDDAPGLVRRAAGDFADYMIVSMRVNASVCSKGAVERPGLQPGVTVSLRPLQRPGYEIEVGDEGVAVAASDDRMAAQALYHLEDVMNLRRGPFLRKGFERRYPRFRHRITFSGFGDDIFPHAHLNQIAHHGFTGIEVWLDDYDVPSQGVRQDVNDLIDRAAKFGLDVVLSPRNRAFVHPDDPSAHKIYDEAYGRMAGYYPKAGGIGFVGEVCEFPSKDPRANGRSHLDKSPKAPGDERPNPGWFPCSDWADWVRVVKDIVRGYNPDCRFLFKTYNWGLQDEKARADLIAALPKDITLIPTFEMFESHVKRNGLVSPVADYSLAFPGPGRYFATEAAQAKAAGIELWSNCNSAGLTWDFGNIPYQPAPWQWKKRWDSLKSASEKWNLSGLRENHEYGWYPSFIAELEKEHMTDGGMDFDAHVRAIAARDFGEANADAAMEAWRLWSRAAEDYVPTDENQYGPCRIGPAYPFNFFGEDLQTGWQPPADFPLEPGAKFAICHFDFAKPIGGLGMGAVVLESEKELKEIELFEGQVADYAAGAKTFRRIAASLPEGRRGAAVRMAALGEYLMHACQTVVNLKRGRIAWRGGDRAEVERLARTEYANASAALDVVDEDSRLGWLASSGYTGGRAQIEWKLRKMRELYGESVAGRD